MTTARELRESLDLDRLRRVADDLVLRLRLEGLNGPEVAALGAILAGIGTSAVPDLIRDAWMMHLADIADREEQARRPPRGRARRGASRAAALVRSRGQRVRSGGSARGVS